MHSPTWLLWGAVFASACGAGASTLGDGGTDAIRDDAEGWEPDRDALGYGPPHDSGTPLVQCFSLGAFQGDFGRTIVGRASHRRIEATNRCQHPITVRSATIAAGRGYFSIDADTLPDTIESGQGFGVDLRYQPIGETTHEGLLRIAALELGQIEITLSGEGVIPRMSVFPRRIDFGSVVFQGPPGTSGTSACGSSIERVHIYNHGTVGIRIEGIALDSAGEPGFEIVGVTPVMSTLPFPVQPFTLDARTEAIVSLRFRPVRAGAIPQHGTLTVRHELGVTPVTIALDGRGTPPGSATDTFVQPSSSRSDVLWVIDNSSSMTEERAALADDVSSFLFVLRGRSTDHQIAVAIADASPRQDGRVRECGKSSPIITRTSTDPYGLLSCLLDVPLTAADGAESGLGAAKWALIRSMDLDQDPLSNPGASLVRSESKLSIVVVSDADDHSPEASSELRDFFLAMKGGDPTQVELHAMVVPPGTQCIGGSAGYRYFELSEQLGGERFDICTRPLAPSLSAIAERTSELPRSVKLTRPAAPSSIAVLIGGGETTAPPSSYTYDPLARRLIFAEGAMPDAGRIIEVSYTAVCTP